MKKALVEKIIVRSIILKLNMLLRYRLEVTDLLKLFRGIKLEINKIR